MANRGAGPCLASTYGKARLFIGLYCQPSLEQIVKSVAAAKIIALNEELKINMPRHSHLIALNKDTHCLNLLSDFDNCVVPQLAS